MRLISFSILLFITLLNLASWAWMNRSFSFISWEEPIQSLSFSPYQKDDDPTLGKLPSSWEIDQDLARVAGLAHSIRTYTVSDGLEVVPELAQNYNLEVTAGAWLDRRLEHNQEEVQSVIQLAQQYSNVTQLIVGNEVLLRNDISAGDLMEYLRTVRSQVNVPVSTAEPIHIWLKYPDLANEVDFIAVHILPYWEGVAAEEAIAKVLKDYRKIQQRFPNKHIVIAEMGWPSAGRRIQFAEPGRVNQARVLREFLNIAKAENIEYNLIEAFDQPWKAKIEGGVGAHWGIFDTQREPKFDWDQPVKEYGYWPLQAAISSLLTLLFLFWLMRRWTHLNPAGMVFFALLVQVATSLIIWTISIPMLRAFVEPLELMVLVPLQSMLYIATLIGAWELTELVWTRQMRRYFPPIPHKPLQRHPKVSLHLAICNEPPEMVKQTLDSLANLDYSNYEVLVIDNNTMDPEVWKPVEAHCQKLGEKFRFFTLGKCLGFKAGALNFALSQTAKDVDIIGIVDSDYIVEPNWLRALLPYFEDDKIAFVQAPQSHREWEQHPFQEMINWEYAGFFYIGMVTRNEANAIIQHGTMSLIRSSALTGSGGWSEWCICEDAELGLRLLLQGYESIYVNHEFGRGLTPSTFSAYKKQRFRWAYGALQILKAHSKNLNPFCNTPLNAAQKYHFITGWMPWFVDALHLVFTALSLLWSIGLVVAPNSFQYPLQVFILSVLGIFVSKVLHHLVLYRTLMNCTWKQRLGSMLAGMGLTYTVALAMWRGLFTRHTPFMRTPKCEGQSRWISGLRMAWQESLLMLLLWIAIVAVLIVRGYEDPDAVIWAIALFIQSTPYLAALASSLISTLPAKAAT